MKVKKYIASSMTEAMKYIREELGYDAVILSSKPIYTGGFLGLFRKRNIEVIAAIDPKPDSSQMIMKQKERKVPPTPSIEPIEPIKNEHSEPSNHLLKEIADLKGMIEGLSSTVQQDIQYPELIENAYSFLIDQEIDAQVRSQIMEPVLAKWRAAQHEVEKEEIVEWMKASFLDSLEWIDKKEQVFQKKYINIVGPTGVGKTTTLAKMAAETMLKHRKKVAFITTDTYRIAAIDQLKTYAKILNVPIEVAYNLEDFKQAADRFSHYDTVFIDTAGRNFRNEQYVKDLNNIIDFSKELDTYLVLSLTSKAKDMEKIYSQFSSIPIKQVIFTKADETASYGAMLNFIQNHKLPPLYITTGQNVPDDIEKATPSNIVKTVFGAHPNE